MDAVNGPAQGLRRRRTYQQLAYNYKAAGTVAAVVLDPSVQDGAMCRHTTHHVGRPRRPFASFLSLDKPLPWYVLDLFC